MSNVFKENNQCLKPTGQLQSISDNVCKGKIHYILTFSI